MYRYGCCKYDSTGVRVGNGTTALRPRSFSSSTTATIGRDQWIGGCTFDSKASCSDVIKKCAAMHRRDDISSV